MPREAARVVVGVNVTVRTATAAWTERRSRVFSSNAVFPAPGERMKFSDKAPPPASVSRFPAAIASFSTEHTLSTATRFMPSPPFRERHRFLSTPVPVRRRGGHLPTRHHSISNSSGASADSFAMTSKQKRRDSCRRPRTRRSVTRPSTHVDPDSSAVPYGQPRESDTRCSSHAWLANPRELVAGEHIDDARGAEYRFHGHQSSRQLPVPLL